MANTPSRPERLAESEIRELYRRLRLDSEEARQRLHRIGGDSDADRRTKWRIEWSANTTTPGQ